MVDESSGLKDALEWRGRVWRVEPDKHMLVENGLESARYLVELVKSFLKVIR